MDDYNKDLSNPNTNTDISMILSLENSVNDKMQNELVLKFESKMLELLEKQNKFSNVQSTFFLMFISYFHKFF